MRRATATVALLGSVCVLSACGKSSPVVTTTVIRSYTVTGAAPEAKAPTPSHTGSASAKRQAREFAAAVNLRADDLPGFRVQAKTEQSGQGEQRLEAEMVRCTGLDSSASGAIAEGSSQDFKREAKGISQSVSSEVSVAQSPAAAAKDLATIQSEHVKSCLSHYIGLLFKAEEQGGASVSPVSVTRGTPPKLGTSGSFGWRISATFSVRGVKIPVYLDIFGFIYGPAEVSLLATGIPEPLAASTERRLYSLLVKRAKAHRA